MSKFYIDNNSFMGGFGKLKLFDEEDNKLAKIKHTPMSNKYYLVNNDDEFILRIEETDVSNHVYSISFNEDGSDTAIEIAKKGNLQLGFGLGYFMLLPVIKIPYGNYYGVSKNGDVYVKKNGKFHDIYINNTLIARNQIKKGYWSLMMNSKSCLEVFTDDDELLMFAIGIFFVMDINDFFR